MMTFNATDKIVKRIAESGVEAAAECFAECLKFLRLCASTPDTDFVPSKYVDAGWHEFVLCTRDYTQLCQEQFGGYIHHDPSDLPDEEAYERTRQALLAQNGELNEAFWPPLSAGSCSGNCQSGKCKTLLAASCTGNCSSGKCKTFF